MGQHPFPRPVVLRASLERDVPAGVNGIGFELLSDQVIERR
jgi:hypothetical protein